MSIESGGYFGSNSAEEQPQPIPRYHLDRCEPVMDRDDEDGEYCRWDDVRPFVELEPCENCRDHAKFEEKDFDPVKERDAAYDLGYKDAQQEHMKAQGYYGHHNGCDCAVCEDMYNRDLQRKIVDAEWNKLLDGNATLIKQVEEITERMGRDVQFWKDETRRAIEAGDSSYVKAMKLYGSTVELVDKYRAAFHIIAHMGISGLSWQHDYEKCVNIAKEALEI